jgi:hypothetical protein
MYILCVYVNGVCKNCHKPKGWRVHTWNRRRGKIDCPGKKGAS